MEKKKMGVFVNIEENVAGESIEVVEFCQVSQINVLGPNMCLMLFNKKAGNCFQDLLYADRFAKDVYVDDIERS